MGALEIFYLVLLLLSSVAIGGFALLVLYKLFSGQR
jgi:hypothetical protein